MPERHDIGRIAGIALLEQFLARIEFDAVRGEGKQFELRGRHSGEQRQAPQEFDLVIEQHGFLHTPIPGRSLRHFISRGESGQ